MGVKRERLFLFILNLLNHEHKLDEYEKIDNINSERVIEILKKNKVSLLSLRKINQTKEGNHFFSSNEFNKAYKKEFIKHKNWRKDFVEIKNRLEKKRIEYIFIKSIGTFPHMSDNVDILVKSQDFKLATKILNEMRFIELMNIQEPHKKFFRKFIGGESIVPIHLHERVCWEVPYIENDHLWKNCRKSELDDIVFYPSPEDSILITVAHSFIEDHFITLSDLLKVRKCIKDFDIDWDYIVSSTKKMRWLHAFYTAILIYSEFENKAFGQSLIPDFVLNEANVFVKKRKWIKNVLDKHVYHKQLEMPIKIPMWFVRVHGYLRMLDDPYLGPSTQRVKIIFSAIFQGVRSHLKCGGQPYMLISLSGIDGAGKTKHANTLMKIFQKCEIEPLYVWTRTGSTPIITFLLKFAKPILYSKEAKTNLTHKNIEKEKIFSNKWIMKMWFFFNSLDLTLQYIVRVRIPLFLGYVVICDRFLYDSIVDIAGISKDFNRNKLSSGLLLKINPKPELSFFLDAPAKAVLDRKNEDSFDYLNNQRKLYFQFEDNFIKIDSSEKFEDANEKVSYECLRKYFEKYPIKYDGYKTISRRYR